MVLGLWGIEDRIPTSVKKWRLKKPQIIKNEDMLCSYNMSRAIGYLDQAEALSLQLTYTMLQSNLWKLHE